jgi:non-ribosomal peptide synthetase component F
MRFRGDKVLGGQYEVFDYLPNGRGWLCVDSSNPQDRLVYVVTTAEELQFVTAQQATKHTQPKLDFAPELV